MNLNKVFTKKEALRDLRYQYTNPGSTLCYAGITKIKDFYGRALSLKDIEHFLASSRTYTIHRPFKKVKYVPYYVRALREQFQLDLVQVSKISEFNENINWLLLCTDIFSRKLWVRPQIRKTAKETLKNIKDILDHAKPYPKSLHCDRGSEMKNKQLIGFCAQNSIKLFHPFTNEHAPHVSM